MHEREIENYKFSYASSHVTAIWVHRQELISKELQMYLQASQKHWFSWRSWKADKVYVNWIIDHKIINRLLGKSVVA